MINSLLVVNQHINTGNDWVPLGNKPLPEPVWPYGITRPQWVIYNFYDWLGAYYNSRHLLWFYVNTAIINAHIIYCESFLPISKARSKITNLVFCLQLCDELVAGYKSSWEYTRRAQATVAVIEHNNLSGHDHVRIDVRKKTCCNCTQLGLRTPAG